MSTKNFEVCAKCSGIMVRISEENTSPLIMECKRCGHREWAEIQIPPPWPIDEKAARNVRVILYKEPGKVNMEYVWALRKLNRELCHLPVHQTAKMIESSSFIDLGVYGMEDAQKILKKAESYGLTAALENPEKSLAENHKKWRFFEPFGAPVTVGEPGEDVTIIPFQWIIVGCVIILVVIMWILLT